MEAKNIYCLMQEKLEMIKGANGLNLTEKYYKACHELFSQFMSSHETWYYVDEDCVLTEDNFPTYCIHSLTALVGGGQAFSILHDGGNDVNENIVVMSLFQLITYLKARHELWSISSFMDDGSDYINVTALFEKEANIPKY